MYAFILATEKGTKTLKALLNVKVFFTKGKM